MKDKQQLVSQIEALPGRTQAIQVNPIHYVNQSDITTQSGDNIGEIILGMGCFWGAERLLWQLPGVITTSVGYCGGYTPNPTYDEVCSGQTGHVEVVRVVFDATITTLEAILTTFWENHDPTQGMRQGGDIGTQYRSIIFASTESDRQKALHSKEHYQLALKNAGKPSDITTDILIASTYYYAEEYHQQYLAKNPGGYCGLGGTGVCFI